MNSLQIFSFLNKFYKFYIQIKEFEKYSFNFKQKPTNIVFIKSSSQNSIFEKKKR